MRFSIYLALLVCIATAILVLPRPAIASAETRAEIQMEFSDFAKIPVLHGGRIKPLDSFARVKLKIFSGRDRLKDGTPATAWLAKTLFSPYDALGDRIFLVRNPELQVMLTLEKRRGHLYSYGEIARGLERHRDTIAAIVQTSQERWTPTQNELVTLQKNAHSFKQLLSGVSLVLPLALDIPDNLRETTGIKIPEDGAPPVYLDAAPALEKLRQSVHALHGQKGADVDTYTAEEMAIVETAFALDQIEIEGRQSRIFRVVPSVWDQSGLFVSPWEAHLGGHGSPQTAALIKVWRELAAAYHAENAAAWESAAKRAYDLAVETAQDSVSPVRMALEISYNRTDPLRKSALFYAAAFFMMLAVLLFAKADVLRKAVIVTLAVGFFYHLSAIAVRIVILMRPPVSTLYESVLFVGLICVAAGLVMEYRRRDNNGLLLAAFSGALLGLLSLGNLGGPDDMEVLAAVLNTNFWLAAHVLVITAGYAFCILTALIAHLMLYLRVFGKEKNAENLFSPLYKNALLALLFTTAGTILGGIWADQSWGRFWGWDPKENGALLIVLWLMWLLHGRIARQLRLIDFTAGMAFLNVIVALSWFGVNLLNVGLHSYGFIDAVAWSLALFCTVEIIAIGLPYFLLLSRSKNRKKRGAA